MSTQQNSEHPEPRQLALPAEGEDADTGPDEDSDEQEATVRALLALVNDQQETLDEQQERLREQADKIESLREEAGGEAHPVQTVEWGEVEGKTDRFWIEVMGERIRQVSYEHDRSREEARTLARYGAKVARRVLDLILTIPE